MKFLIDEDVPTEVSRCLLQNGHEVYLVYDVLGARTGDPAIWNHAAETEAVIVTCNRDDFLQLAGKFPSAGLIILHRRRTRQAECRHLLKLLAEAGESGLCKNVNFA